MSTTIGEAGYLQLSARSPALNAGSNSLYNLQGGVLGGDADLAGNPRVYNFAVGGIIDMGAYEYQGEHPSTDIPIRVHSALPPNGDGINEFLMIEAIGDYPDNRVTLIDRNGIILWEASGYDNRQVAFHGRGKGGKLLPAGIYFYMIDVDVDGVKRQLKGYFVVAY